MKSSKYLVSICSPDVYIPQTSTIPNTKSELSAGVVTELMYTNRNDSLRMQSVYEMLVELKIIMEVEIPQPP